MNEFELSRNGDDDGLQGTPINSWIENSSFFGF